MRKIKVAMLGPYLEEHRKYSSIAIHTNLLTKYLSNIEDIELHVITIGNEDGRFKENNINVHVVQKSILYPSCIPCLVRRLRHEIMGIDPDVVHAQVTFTPYSTAATLACKEYPTLLSVRGIVARELKFNTGLSFIFSASIEIINEKCVSSKIPNIIVTSPHSKDVIKTMTNSNICVVPNGIDFDKIQKIGDGYIYLRHVNVIRGTAYPRLSYASPKNITEYSHQFVERSEIYNNGGSEVWK